MNENPRDYAAGRGAMVMLYPGNGQTVKLTDDVVDAFQAIFGAARWPRMN